MNLLPPRIEGPISECCEHVWVRGQLPGATVEIVDIDTGFVIISELATGPNTILTVSSPLIAWHHLAARQILGSDDSGLAAETVQVQNRPNPIGPGIFAQPIFDCARCIYVDGLVPGADVAITSGGSEIGHGHSHVGYARIALSTAISGPVTLSQKACGIDGKELTIAPITPPKELDPPSVEEPLQACRTRVTISDVLPGATIDMERSMGPNGSTCFDLPSLWWGLSPPLVEGETVRTRQRLPNCDVVSAWLEPPRVVGPPDPVPVPWIDGPLCAEGTTVRVCGLLADAQVELLIVGGGHHGVTGGETYHAVAPEDGCFDFVLADSGLPGESIVCVRQILCGKKSDQSEPVMVHKLAVQLVPPKVFEPLYDCSIVVRVGNLEPGTRVHVIADGIGVIGERHADEEEVDVTVRPALREGWKIYAYAIGCGQRSGDSEALAVDAAPAELGPPKVASPPYSCERQVRVEDVVPGAIVDVYRNEEWIGRGHAGANWVEVSVQRGQLAVGDSITAIQEICEARSRPSAAVEVELFDGEWEVLSKASGDPDEDKSEILAVHVALLPTNEIVIFAGDQYTNDGEPIDNTRLMTAGPPWTVKSVTGVPSGYNLFCCGHAMLADGSLLTGGGTESRPPPGMVFHRAHWLGLRGSLRFRQDSNDEWGWETQGDMVTARPSDVRPGRNPENTGGRWYPTLVTLADGRVLAIGGHPLNSDLRHTNTSLEVYDPATQSWSIVGSSDYDNIPGHNEAVSRNFHSEYPGLHVLPDGSVFAASAMADRDMWKWNVGNDAHDWEYVSETPEHYEGNPQPYTSVLLPLREDQSFKASVLLYGGSAAHTIDPETAPTSWTQTSGRMLPGAPFRVYPLATLLPTGEVFVSGGTRTARDATAILRPEIYDPESGDWRAPEAEANEIRNYHSTALLLPDGSVWHSGGNEDCVPGYDTQNRSVEIYRPWYFCWPRPRLDRVTSRVCHGETFSVRTPDANRIRNVALVRLSSFTHAFNPDQRILTLDVERDKEDAHHLRVKMPERPGIAIVGFYLCFALDQERVPSHGLFMQVCPASDSRSEIGNENAVANIVGLLGRLAENVPLDKDVMTTNEQEIVATAKRLANLLKEND